MFDRIKHKTDINNEIGNTEVESIFENDLFNRKIFLR